MRGWALVQHLRALVGLADGEPATTQDAERLLDVVEGLGLEEEPELEAPLLYVYQSGRGVICAPRGWSRRVPDHDTLLEEIFHYLLAPYADGTCTLHGQVNGHRREERRVSDHVLWWWLCHANLAGIHDDEELAESTGRSLEDVRRFRELQLTSS